MKDQFLRLDWRGVACLLGATSLEMAKDGASLVLALPARPEDGRPDPRRLLVTDNGGEVNLDWLPEERRISIAEWRGVTPPPLLRDARRGIETAYFGSVPYVSWRCLVGPLTLASRLHDALAGREIDYHDFDLRAGGKPADDDLAALRVMAAAPDGVSAGFLFTAATAKACVKHGWAREIRSGLYQITPDGRALLGGVKP